MSKKLFKYISPDYIDKVFLSNKHISLRCSYPKDFNDPYELFLTLDFNIQPEVLAFYADIIGDLPQKPTTCFSRSPSVIPMWAHYTNNLQGFVIELDEETLSSHFPNSAFGDIDYQDKPNDSIKDILYQAYVTAKPRHTYILTKAVMSAAYYTKFKCWNYEQERRMVSDSNETRNTDDLILIDIPLKCVSAIICGPRAKVEIKKTLHDLAENIKCNYFEMKIGHSSSIPFFFDNSGNSYIFDEGMLHASHKFCSQCKEPLLIDRHKCAWCLIDDSLRVSAAERNPYRMLANHGMLNSYIVDMDKIRQNHRKK